MTIVLLVLGVWFSLLVAYVALKARQPKLVHPTPPRLVARSTSRRHAA
ncbi:hypothetical protein [Nocardioides caldifontis]|nr:hypothetical protein [Nocardioides caldifontis]